MTKSKIRADLARATPEAETHGVRVDDTALLECRDALNKIGRFMGVVPGIAQCPDDVAREAIKRLSALEPAPVQGWRTFETAPDDGMLILASCPPCPRFPEGRVMIWKADMLASLKDGAPNHLQFPATHWQPLPKAADAESQA